MSASAPVDVSRILTGLKPFQRRSVDYVFDRLYGRDATSRFLLADEVGLGKTLVARGVIARAIEHLRQSGRDRIDVVYICSNADIARQNINRLNVTGQPDFQFATRITLLPEQVHDLSQNAVNFISFTPGTSLRLGRSTGQGAERWLLYWLLAWTWPDVGKGTGAKNLMQVSVSRDRFRQWLREYDETRIDRELAKRFEERVLEEDKSLRDRGQETYSRRFRDLCFRFRWSRKHIPDQDRADTARFIGEMRQLLAETCVHALNPDLVILDEFQRFKDVLRADNEAGELAQHLFSCPGAKVLLLSATPYKMYTLSHEAETDDHYRDFLDTLRFLFDDDAAIDEVTHHLDAYARAGLRAKADDIAPLVGLKREVESRLRRVMSRTEKLALTDDRNGMLREASGESPRVGTLHVRDYLDLARVARELEQPDVLEYWKASPYLLNFMAKDHYKLKESLARHADDGGSSPVASRLAEAEGLLLKDRMWKAYEEVPYNHAQMEALAKQTVETGLWRLLWLPPSLPYYRLDGVFAEPDVRRATKRLVFSSWHVVPQAISALLSYEAERRMVTSFNPRARNTPQEHKRIRPLLMFTKSEGRLTGMPVLSLLYPSQVLATLGDPVVVARGMSFPSLSEVLTHVAERLQERLDPMLARAPGTGAEDESWYWAAPILLDRADRRASSDPWFASVRKPWGDDDELKGWVEHLQRAEEAAHTGWWPTGRPPADLAEVLALNAVAGPANCALRALAGALPTPVALGDERVRIAATAAAWGLRSLFITPEVMALIRGMNSAEPYWRRVLEYCANGCLQSVLDEYLHLLVESEGLSDRPADDALEVLARLLQEVAGLRAAAPGFDWVHATQAGELELETHRTRARFAMRFGDRVDRETSATRKDLVRDAFNSPFWPFVLATTSVGQEGLDFHPYCHAVVHWNLPSNPVDMEQREGRVHRYKGHAVRKNVAAVVPAEVVHAQPGNPWPRAFEHAAASSVQGDDSGISPYWVFPLADGAAIERHTLMLPLSRESARMPALRASLAIYRMVFGQPRQDDLLEHLRRTVPEAELQAVAKALSIDLEPR